MIENTWGTTNPLLLREEGCTSLLLGMNGTFKYTITDDTKIINEDNWWKELVYPIQTELSTCFNSKSFKSYDDLLSSKEELAKCVKENLKVEGIEYNEIIVSNINLSDDSQVQYDYCKNKNNTTETNTTTEETTGTQELITPNNNTNNKSTNNTIYFIIGAAVVVVIIIALILIKVLKKKNVLVDNTVNVQNQINMDNTINNQNSVDINNNQNNTLQ